MDKIDDNSSLANPQELDINSFPKEVKPKRKKRSIFSRLKAKYQYWKDEREWRKREFKKKSSFLLRFLRFLAAPFIDFAEDRKLEKEKKKLRQKENQPSFFQSLRLMYLENRETAKQTKKQDRELRKSLSFVVEENKRVFSLAEEIAHIKDTWKALPWDRNREFENMFLSTVIIVLSFSFNYLLLQFSKFATASFYDIPSKWQDGRIVFTIPDPSKLWTYSSVISVYISGPILLFFSGIIFFWLYNRNREKNSVKALVFLWMYLAAFVLFFGSFLAGTITDRGFGYVMGWLYIPKYIEMPFGIFSVFMLWMIGYSAGKRFISLTPGYQFYTSTLPQFFIKLLYVYIPVLISIAILFLIGFNNRDFTIQIIYLSFIIMLTPTLRYVHDRMT